MKKTLLYILFVVIVFVAVGCQKPAKVEKQQVKPAYDTPLAAGEFALRKITNPAEIPDFTFAGYTLLDIKKALENSQNYLSKASSKQRFPIGDITHQKVIDSLDAFEQLLDSGLRGRELNQAIRSKFDVYMSVGCDRAGTVLFTGYYTPIFDGSLKKTAKFKYPLYKAPADLVKDADGNILGRKTASGSTEKYPSRQQIESQNLLTGNELVWLSDPFEAYIIHVQGSAKIRLPDGKLYGVGYAGTNGHEYKSMAKQMLSKGAMQEKNFSLATMIDYFKNHPDEVSAYTALNPRFVFFKEETGNPRGCLNEPVTDMRTIATDKSIFPAGALTFISTYLPRLEADGSMKTRVYTGFAFDQDAGGAIRAPGRCDIYIGTGAEAGKRAGGVYQEGKLYYLFVK